MGVAAQACVPRGPRYLPALRRTDALDGGYLARQRGPARTRARRGQVIEAGSGGHVLAAGFRLRQLSDSALGDRSLREEGRAWSTRKSPGDEDLLLRVRQSLDGRIRGDQVGHESRLHRPADPFVDRPPVVLSAGVRPRVEGKWSGVSRRRAVTASALLREHVVDVGRQIGARNLRRPPRFLERSRRLDVAPCRLGRLDPRWPSRAVAQHDDEQERSEYGQERPGLKTHADRPQAATGVRRGQPFARRVRAAARGSRSSVVSPPGFCSARR